MVVLQLLQDTHTSMLLCMTSSIFCKISYEELDFNHLEQKMLSDYLFLRPHKKIFMIFMYIILEGYM